jgi:hypothetical protein
MTLVQDHIQRQISLSVALNLTVLSVGHSYTTAMV